MEKGSAAAGWSITPAAAVRKMTEFERGQLMHWHFMGQPAYRNEAGNRYPAEANRRMLDRFLKWELIDGHARLTVAGEAAATFLHESELPYQSVGR